MNREANGTQSDARRQTKGLAPAFQKDDRLLEDIARYRERATGDPERFGLWWLGQSGFLISWAGRQLLFDPYLSDSLTRKYAETDKPHVRLTELVVDPSRLDFLDVVTSSHNHTDHLDGETLSALLGASPSLELVVPAANRAFAADRLEVPEERLRPARTGEALQVGAFRLTAVPAAHEGLDVDDEGQNLYVGYVCEFGPFAVYHSGDTLLYEGMVEILSQWSLDLAILPINGRKPERRVAGNLDAIRAAYLTKATAARLAVPCHYDLFEFNTADPRSFVEECEKLGLAHRVLRNGEGTEILSARAP